LIILEFKKIIVKINKKPKITLKKQINKKMSLNYSSNDSLNNQNSSKRIPMKDWRCRDASLYSRISQVGEGTFGKVYKAQYKSKTNTNYVALKKILINENEGFPITAMREILIMKRLHHQNILKLIEIVLSEPNEKNKNRGNFYLVFEYMEHDLSVLSTFHINYSLSEIKCILHQILNGIGYLHKNNIIHRDIKSANILLNNKGEIKIGDFGLARIINPNPNIAKRYTNRVVTLWYRAPELLLGETNYGFAIDVWSIGCVFSELLTGFPLFNGRSDNEQIEKIFEKCGIPNEDSWKGVTKLIHWKDMCPNANYTFNLREIYKDNKKVDDITFDLLSKMLILDPSKRITVKEALEHDFFKFEPIMCKPEELTIIGEDSHEYQSRKDYKQNKILMEANRGNRNLINNINLMNNPNNNINAGNNNNNSINNNVNKGNNNMIIGKSDIETNNNFRNEFLGIKRNPD